LEGTSFGYTSLSLISCSFNHCISDRNGGALYLRDNCEFLADSSLFASNSSQFGGAIYSHNNISFNISNSTFSNNTATYDVALPRGGAVMHTGESVQHTANYNGCTFENNSSGHRGGAIWTDRVATLANNASFINNTAAENGGAIYVYHFSVGQERTHVADSCQFTGNAASQGAVYYYTSSGSRLSNLVATNSQFHDNTANSGGCFYVSASDSVFLHLENSVFSGNSTTQSSGDGGVLNFTGGGQVTCINSNFENNESLDAGGAIYIQTGGEVGINMQTSGCAFSNNTSDEGGAIFAKNDSSRSITLLCDSTSFENNTSNTRGGAFASELFKLSSLEFSECAFNGNNTTGATSGGGGIYVKSFNTDTCLITVYECSFNGNSAISDAGALQLLGDGSIRANVEQSVFTNNSSGVSGGALRLYSYSNNYAELNLQNVFMAYNNSGTRGGALALDAMLSGSETIARVNQCLFHDNTSSVGGAIAANLTGSSAILNYSVLNSTITSNDASSKCGGVHNLRTNGNGTVNIINSILWDNTDTDTEINEKQAYISNANIIGNISYCDIAGGNPPLFFDAGGNIFVDPLFTNPTLPVGNDLIYGTADDGLRVDETSGCIDAANAVYSATSDITNQPRPLGDGFDIGAYEVPGAPDSPCVGDLTGDGNINTADLLIYISFHGCTSDCGVADLSGDGVVGITDLLMLTAVFGSTCP
jgi:predicted outer membrane repeat protein